MIMVIIFMIIIIKMIKIKMIMVIIKQCLFVFSDYQDDDHDYGHGDIDFLSLNRIYWRMFEALVNFLQMMYFQLLSPDERKHWGCKILLDCLGRWPNIWVRSKKIDFKSLQDKTRSNSQSECVHHFLHHLKIWMLKELLKTHAAPVL